MPACEQAVKTKIPRSRRCTARNRSSRINSSGSQPPPYCGPHLPLQTLLVGRDTWDLAAEIERAIEQQPSVIGHDKLAAGHFKLGRRRNLAERQQAPVGADCGPVDKHPCIDMHRNRSPALSAANQPERGRHAAYVVEMPV